MGKVHIGHKTGYLLSYPCYPTCIRHRYLVETTRYRSAVTAIARAYPAGLLPDSIAPDGPLAGSIAAQPAQVEVRQHFAALCFYGISMARMLMHAWACIDAGPGIAR